MNETTIMFDFDFVTPQALIKGCKCAHCGHSQDVYIEELDKLCRNKESYECHKCGKVNKITTKFYIEQA